MSTLRKYQYELLEAVNEYTDDSKLTLRLLEQYIINYRVKWFENTYNKFQKQIPEIYFQTLSCVPVALVDQSDDCCGIVTGCKILRTVDKIPTFISLSDGEIISKVSPVGIINIPFHIIRYEQAEWFGNGRYNQNKIGVFLYNNYLYLISKDEIYYPLIERINIRGVFRDPREAGNFVGCDNKPCWSYDSIFPLEERLWTYVKTDILQTEIAPKIQTVEDLKNDNKFEKPNMQIDGGVNQK